MELSEILKIAEENNNKEKRAFLMKNHEKRSPLLSIILLDGMVNCS